MNVPQVLQIQLTDRCNLRCRLCSNPGPREPRTLPLASVLRGIDLYASCLGRGGRAATVNFRGGEPLLEYPALCAALARLRGMRASVSTNGTLLTQERAGSLLGRGVHISVSMDCAGEEDVRRAFIARLPRLRPEQLARIDAEFTLTPRTLPRMPDAVAFLKGLGFRLVCVHFDLRAPWDAEQLAGLSRAMAGASWRSNEVFFEAAAPYRWTERRSLVLSSDGVFFPCYTACSRALADARVGDLERGIDLGRLRRIFDSVLAVLPKDRGHSLYPFLDRYYCAKSLRRDPAAMVESGCRAGRLLARAVDGMKAEERVLERLDKDPHFGDFGHEPRYRSKDELASIRLPMGSGLPDELARLRQAADFCLYSPGRGKTLLMVPKDPKASFQLVEGIALYSRLKAESLKKRLSLRLLADASSLSAEQLRFLDDHGVLHSRALLSLERGDALWSDSELDALRGAAGLPIDLAGSCDPRPAEVLR